VRPPMTSPPKLREIFLLAGSPDSQLFSIFRASSADPSIIIHAVHCRRTMANRRNLVNNIRKYHTATEKNNRSSLSSGCVPKNIDFGSAARIFPMKFLTFESLEIASRKSNQKTPHFNDASHSIVLYMRILQEYGNILTYS